MIHDACRRKKGEHHAALHGATPDAVESIIPLRFNAHTRALGEEEQRGKRGSTDGRDTSRVRETNIPKPAFSRDKDGENMGCGVGCAETMGGEEGMSRGEEVLPVVVQHRHIVLY